MIGGVTPMRQVARLGRFRLYVATGRHFVYPGWHLWTGRAHRQVWPLRRFGRVSDV